MGKNELPRVRPGERIQGVVVSAASVGSAVDVALSVQLRPWLDASGALRRDALYVRVPAKSWAAARRAGAKWQGRVVSVQVSKTYDRGWSAAAPALRAVTSSPSLLAEVTRQAKPRVYRSRVLGSLRLDRGLGVFAGFRGKGKLAHEVLVAVSDPDDDKKVAKAFERAEGLVLRVEEALPAIRDAIADELLDDYNETWRRGGRPLSRTAFKRRPTLASVDVGPRRITVYFNDGALFGDHLIEVRMSPRLAITEICLAG